MNWFAIVYYVFLAGIVTAGAVTASVFGAIDDSLDDAFQWLFYFWVISLAIFAGIGHLFFAQKVSASLGWAASPFERELGFLQISIAVWGIVSSSSAHDAEKVLAGLYGLFLVAAGLNHFSGPFTPPALVIAIVDLVLGASLVVISSLLLA